MDYDEITQDEYNEQIAPYQAKWDKYQTDNMNRLLFAITNGSIVNFNAGGGDNSDVWIKQTEGVAVDGTVYDVYIQDNSGFYTGRSDLTIEQTIIKKN